MRIVNLAGRAALQDGVTALDVETASDGRFGPDPQLVFHNWAPFAAWAESVLIASDPRSRRFSVNELLAPVPTPAQVFGIGLNYADHIAESRMEAPQQPLVFTKFPSSLTGPRAVVRLAGDRVDWEAELVVVIGARARDVPVERGWDIVAGLTVGQDLSDRTVQSRGAPAQFSMGRSFSGHAPIGPAVVGLDEVRRSADPNALAIGCRLVTSDGAPDHILQQGNTRDLIFGVPQLIARLSEVVELLPGDLVFPGTPSEVGLGRDPEEFLRPGHRLVTEIEGLGFIEQRFVA